MIKLALLWARVQGLFGKVVDFVAKHPWPSACAVLAASIAWLLIFTIPGLEREVEREAAAHEQTKKNYREAQEMAAAEWAAERARYEQEKIEEARRTDEKFEEANRTAMAAAERFIRNNRVQCSTQRAPSSGAAGGPAPSSAGGNTESNNGPGEVSELVAVRPNDVRICTENTERLRAAREWGLEQ